MARGTRLGVQISPRVVRAVRLGPRDAKRADAMEVEWAGELPDEPVDALVERFGRVSAVGVALDLDLLFLKNLTLPPLATAEARRAVELDPERYFPVRDQPMSAAVGDRNGDASTLVFTMPERVLERWMTALERLGPVESIEPAPMALARAVTTAGTATATIVAPGSAGSSALVRVVDGRVAAVRKVRGGVGSAIGALDDRTDETAPIYVVPPSDGRPGEVEPGAPDSGLPALPAMAGVAPSFLCALGAAEGIGSAEEYQFAPPGVGERRQRRRWRRVVTAAGALGAALVLLVTGVDHYRRATAAAIEREIASYRDRATAVLTRQSDVEALSAASAALADAMGERINPLTVLLSLTRHLPEGAFLRAVRGTGDEWQVDGYARDAATVIPALEASPVFDRVRFRTATSRVELGGTTYEDFSLALRIVPAS